MDKNTVSWRVVWAVDPFNDEPELQRSALSALRSILHDSPVVIDPVYINPLSWMSGFTEVPLAEMTIRLTQEACIAGQEKLDAVMANQGLPTLNPLHVISEPGLSLRQGIHQMVDYAKGTGAKLILLSTHARTGLQRWVLGSFAETAILNIDFPLLVMHSKLSLVQSYNRILFPTDFSDTSYAALSSVVEYAKEFDSEVILFHKFDFEWPSSIENVYSSSPQFHEILTQEMTERRQLLQDWVHEVSKSGVKCISQFDPHVGDSVSEAILVWANRFQCVIAMVAQSGLIRTALLGSATRSVVRGASVPVWVLHPSPKVQSAMEKKSA